MKNATMIRSCLAVLLIACAGVTVLADNIGPPVIPPFPPPVTIVDNWDPVTGTGSVSITVNRPILLGDPGVNVKITDGNGNILGSVMLIATGVTYTADFIGTPGDPAPEISIEIWSPNAPAN